MNPQKMMMANNVLYSPQELESLVRGGSDQEEQAVSVISNKPHGRFVYLKPSFRSFVENIKKKKKVSRPKI